jgi:hypothetical protein
MNTSSDTLSHGAEEKVETTREQPQPAHKPELIELGKVSDTKGGWWGVKPDSGAGFSTY